MDSAELTTENDMDSMELENAFAQIFINCDSENSGNVQVSTLLTFIEPHLESNQEHYAELKKILDPGDINPTISYDNFAKIMKIWTKKFNNPNEKVTKRLSDENLKRSTPTKESAEKYPYFDCGLNVSNISSYSTGSAQSSCDPTFLNEQINELQYQNKKLSEMLNDVQLQLSTSDELNNNLQNEVEKLKKDRQMDQKLIEDLQKMRKDFEKEREENSLVIKNYSCATESLNFYKKENATLKKQMSEIETEIEKIQEINSALQYKESELNSKIENLRQEIEIKDEETLVLQEKLNEVNTACSEKESHMKDILEELETARYENNNLQKRLEDIKNKNISTKHDLSNPVDSETDPDKSMSVSLSPEIPLDECFLNASVSPVGHESLQAELIKASNSECFGSVTFCEHKLQLIELEEQIENLNYQIIETNEKHKQDETEKENLRSQLQEHINKIIELKKEILLLSENQKLTDTIQKENLQMCSLNMQLKSDIALIKSENKRHARLEQKIKNLENEIFEQKTKSDHLTKQNETLLTNLKEINIITEILKKEKIELEKQNAEVKIILTENKKLKTNINELSKNIRDLERQKSILELEKLKIEKKLSEEIDVLNNLKANLKLLSQKTSDYESENEYLKNKLAEEVNNVKEIKLTVSRLICEKKILEDSKQEYNEQKYQELKEVLLKTKSQLTNKLNENKNTIRNLQSDLTEEKNNYYVLSTVFKELENKNAELEKQVQINSTKLQNFRKANSELRQDVKITTSKYDSLINHINLATQQIKGCADILGKNTLQTTQIWKTELEIIVGEIPFSNCVEESFLPGKLTEVLKYLMRQTQLTAILLLSLAKIKENQSLGDSGELSEVFVDDSVSRPLLTQSTFESNCSNFFVNVRNISSSSSVPLPSFSMSPECAQTEMTEEEIHFSSPNITNPEVSLSNNSLDDAFVSEENRKIQNGEVAKKEEENMEAELRDVESEIENKSKKVPLQKYRSKSDGATIHPQLTDTGDITLFPNLQDNILDSLGLLSDQSGDRGNEHLTEEEIEAKFQTLALIFSIDSKTLAQRRELQKRQRNQADDNFATEVERLEQGILRLAPLCTDPEVKELVTALLNRLNIIVKAAQRISISTQVYGGVQQEFRVAAAVNLMLVHLRNIQQQRDTVKRQLLCTKKMLQESTIPSSETNSSVVVSRRLSTSVNGRVVTRRRASIATIPRPLDSPSASGAAGVASLAKRPVRRISADVFSEHSAKHWDSRHRPDWMPQPNPLAGRLSRPSRIELNLDLKKIHESSVDLDSMTNSNEESDSDINSFQTPTELIPSSGLFLENQTSPVPETFSDHVVNILSALANFLKYCWNRWIRNGTAREIILFIWILFVCLSSLIILNVIIVSKFTRSVQSSRSIPWAWITWEELWDIFVDVQITGPRPI